MKALVNVGRIDRIARIAVGVALLSAVVLVEGRERWLGLLGLVPLLTAAVRICPLYTALGIRTCPAPEKTS